MESVAQALLVLHVAAGAVAFVVAPVAMAARKGGQAHRLAGRLYACSMAVALLVVVPLSVLRSNPFLLAVALFSGYLVFSGYRALYRKRPDRGQGPTPWDQVVAGLAVLVGVAMVGWGAGAPHNGGLNTAPMLIVFGTILTAVAGLDLRAFRTAFDPARHRQRWFFDHIGRMLGATIATYTAVAVVNLTMLPPVVRWLGPTAIGAAGIAWTVARYKRRFARGARPSDVATVKIGMRD